jgi:hypothetical protein
MLHRKSKSRLPLLKNPGDPALEYCGPGSIEQLLDMCEEGELRGEETERHIDRRATPNEPLSGDPLEVVDEMESFQMNFSERDREGDEMSGDDHSSGLQGGDAELEDQRHIDSGIPGSGYDSWLEWPSPAPAAPQTPEGAQLFKSDLRKRHRKGRKAS